MTSAMIPPLSPIFVSSRHSDRSAYIYIHTFVCMECSAKRNVYCIRLTLLKNANEDKTLPRPVLFNIFIQVSRTQTPLRLSCFIFYSKLLKTSTALRSRNILCEIASHKYEIILKMYFFIKFDSLSTHFCSQIRQFYDFLYSVLPVSAYNEHHKNIDKHPIFCFKMKF